MIDNRGVTAGRTVGSAVRNHPAPVTYGLIALCCVVFLLSPSSGFNPVYGTGDRLLAAQSDYFERWGVIPAQLLTGSPRAALTTVSALFVHGSYLHLLGNMLFLYVFGAMVEERMGHLPFALFYLISGCAALLGYAIGYADSEQTLVGASGAISAVLGALLYLFPAARVTSLFPFLFFLPLRFPAWVVLPFWAALQWAAARQVSQGPGVAYLAHLVGFSVGFLYAWVRYRGKGGVGEALLSKDGGGRREG
ncbi:rhomboid family intramembrane serine protease [Streptomyces sp. NPDC048641]|uniref:rhomboid family intramembrane serine protease n=1 Tax=Streptomyces sp. NPDC048641 TaxID=3154825 RepID=UPI003430128E